MRKNILYIILLTIVFQGCQTQDAHKENTKYEQNQTIIAPDENNETNTTKNDKNTTHEQNQTIITPDENNETNTTEPTTVVDKSLIPYYQNALGKKGIDLKESLHTIISNAKFYTYSEAYNLLDIIDQDVNNTANVILFYKQISVPASNKCHSSASDCWNREHMWPKSLGVGYDSSIACYTDLHHLRPSDAVVNSDRGNKMYAEATTSYSKIPNFYWDKSTSSWEVSDNLKGDVARVMFYMSVRYDGDGSEPDLEIYAYDESISRPAELCLMLQWNKLDPVSNVEKQRNNLVYHYQENRNPFVDNSKWADDIWALECSSN